MFGETMEKHLFPGAIWIDTINGIRYNAADSTKTDDQAYPTQAQIGDIVVHRAEFIPILRSGMLSTVTKVATNGTSFYRDIAVNRGSLEPEFIGYLLVQAPIPEPDTFFGSLAQDPLLAGIPTGLRPKVDPAMVVPSPNPDCKRDSCYQFIAVSNQAVQYLLSPLLMSIQSADVFYYGPKPTNTACLSAITTSPPLPTRPPIPMYVPISACTDLVPSSDFS